MNVIQIQGAREELWHTHSMEFVSQTLDSSRNTIRYFIHMTEE